MTCQKCQVRDAVTFSMEVKGGRVATLLVCKECFLPLNEGAFSRLTHEARRILLRASREMTDVKSANRIRPALLYFLLEGDSTPLNEAVSAAGIQPSHVREEIAAYLAGDTEEETDWVSPRGITPVLVGARAVAERMESDSIGPEHLFLGLIESPEPGDPLLMISLAGRAGDVEQNLTALTALTP